MRACWCEGNYFAYTQTARTIIRSLRLPFFCSPCLQEMEQHGRSANDTRNISFCLFGLILIVMKPGFLVELMYKKDRI
ncbi:unnamed protein product, partial [Dicrocoelium dendriticum]